MTDTIVCSTCGRTNRVKPGALRFRCGACRAELTAPATLAPSRPAGDSGLIRFTCDDLTRDWTLVNQADVSNALVNNGTCYLVIDVSGSMNKHERLDGAKNGAIAYGRDAISRGYTTGIIVFSDRADCVVSATNNINEIVLAVSDIDADGNTQMHLALQLGREVLRAAAGSRVLTVITDGIATDEALALEEARRVKADGIEIIAIGVGEANAEFLQQLASMTSLHVGESAKELGRAVADSARLLPAGPPR